MELRLEYNGNQIHYVENGFINATEMAKIYSRKPDDFFKTKQAGEYEQALSDSLGKQVEDLRFAIHGGDGSHGTFIHPKLALRFSQWLNPKFAVWVDGQIEKLLSGKTPVPKITDEEFKQSRKDCTEIFQKHGCTAPFHYADLTNEQYKIVLGGTAGAIKKQRGLKPKDNLRQNLTPLERAYMKLEEAATGVNVVTRNASSYEECKVAVKDTLPVIETARNHAQLAAP